MGVLGGWAVSCNRGTPAAMPESIRIERTFLAWEVLRITTAFHPAYTACITQL